MNIAPKDIELDRLNQTEDSRSGSNISELD